MNEPRPRSEALASAVLEQLRAEIGASPLNVKALARAMGADYFTFRRYVNGERDLPMKVLWSALDSLGVDEVVFMRRARDRYEEEQAD